MNLLERTLENLNEALTPQQRRAKGRVMKRLAPKLARKRKIASRKKAGTEKLMGRAKKAAKELLRNRILKNKKYNELPFAQRAMVDKKIEKKSALIDKIAKKLLPSIRKKEVERLKNRNKGDK